MRERLKLAEMRAALGSQSEKNIVLNRLNAEDAMHFASEAGLYSHLKFEFKGEALRSIKIALRKIESAKAGSPRTKEEIEDLVYEARRPWDLRFRKVL